MGRRPSHIHGGEEGKLEVIHIRRQNGLYTGGDGDWKIGSHARMPTSPSPLSPTDAFAKLSLTSPILRTEDPTMSPLTHDVLTSPVPPALSRRRQISPCSTSDAMDTESFDDMAVGSPLMAASSSDVPMPDAPPRRPLPRRKPAKKSSSPPPIHIDENPAPRVNDHSTLRRPSAEMKAASERFSRFHTGHSTSGNYRWDAGRFATANA